MKLRIALISFLFGLCSGMLAMFAYILSPMPYILLVVPARHGTYVMDLILVSVIAPLIEESTKFFFVMFLANEEGILKATDMGIMGLLCGAGFSIIENVLYGLLFTRMFGFYAAIILTILRFLVSSPIHAIATATSCYCYGLYREHRLRSVVVVLGLFLAMLIHGLHNFVSSVL